MNSHQTDRLGIIRLFSDAPLATQSFIWLRWRLTPYRRIASALPDRGRILDLGSGHGLLSLALTLGSSQREIIGVDHDAERVRIAETALARAGSSSTPRFQVGDLLESVRAFPNSSLAGIAMIDILHYFDDPAQRALLAEAARVLEPGGIIAMREVNPAGGIASAWNRLYESLSLRVGFTRSLRREMRFRSPAGWTTMLETVGFVVRSEPCGSPVFSDVLFTGERAP